MRRQYLSLRSLLFVIASLFRLCHCEEHKRRSNLIIYLFTLSLVLGFPPLAWAIISIPDTVGIDFQPNTGHPGEPVSVSICLFGFEEEVVGVIIDGEGRYYDVCNTFGPCTLNCDLGEILQFSCTNHIVSFSIGSVGSLPLEFKNGEEGCPEPNLFVTIPGINDHGEMMLEGAKKIVRYDDECKVFIMEKLRPSITAVQKAVANASKKAMGKGKDVVVLIDMDLENYTFEFPLPPFLNRWKRSVSWAGKMANIVSDAFSKEAPGGKRILYAHSAGGDATYQTILQTPRIKEKGKWKWKWMYDDINIFNGRTSAINLKNVLKSRGYSWRQVKVFTNRGDCPANPFWALANYDVVKGYAGASWVHLHCCDIITCTDPLSFCGCHSALRDSIPDGIIGTFEVNLSPKTGTPDCTVPATVEELMTRNWRR